MPYTKPVYASGNPTVDQLFGREFSAWQAEDKGRQADEANQVARAQIAAQAQLAQAQQRANIDQQQYANLFRMQELTSREKSEAERNRLFGRQIDVQEKGLTAGRDATSDARKDAAKEAQKFAVNTANTDAKAAAAKYQDIYDSAVNEAVRKAKEDVWGYVPGAQGRMDVFDKPGSPERLAFEALAWDRAIGGLKGDKTAGGLVIPNFKTRTFHPVQYDSEGNPIGAPFTAPPGTPDVYDEFGNPKTKPDLGTASGLGTTPAVVTPVVPANPAAIGTPASESWMSRLSRFQYNPTGAPRVPPVAPVNPAALGVAPTEVAPVEPVAAPVVAPTVGAPQVRRRLGNGNDTVLISAEDDAELSRQLAAVVPEQRPAVYAVIVGQWLKSGRASYSRGPVPVASPVAPSLGTMDTEQRLLDDYRRRTAPLFDPTAVRGSFRGNE